MRIIARKTLVRFAEAVDRRDRQAVGRALFAWYREVSDAHWPSPAALKETYRNASIVADDRVVFNIKGNSYRLVAAIDYRRAVVYIKWIGSHEDYDDIDARSVRFGD